MKSLFDEEQIMKSFIRSERHDEAREKEMESDQVKDEKAMRQQ